MAFGTVAAFIYVAIMSFALMMTYHERKQNGGGRLIYAIGGYALGVVWPLLLLVAWIDIQLRQSRIDTTKIVSEGL